MRRATEKVRKSEALALFSKLSFNDTNELQPMQKWKVRFAIREKDDSTIEKPKLFSDLNKRNSLKLMDSEMQLDLFE